MSRRRNTLRTFYAHSRWGLSAAALFAFAVPAAFAGVITPPLADYRIVNTQSADSAPITEILANAVPAGSIFEPEGRVSPLTIMAGSSGLTASDVQVVVGDGKNSTTGQPVQVIQINFDSAGFKSGGVLNFSLETSTATPPQLELVAPVSGLTISQIPSSSGLTNLPGSTGGGGPITNAIPEPVSALLWTVAAAGILLRARSYRKRDPFQV